MSLRASQVETLRAVPRFDRQESTAAHVGAWVNCSLRAGRRRLDELEALGLVEKTGRRLRNGAAFYRLTPKGEEAIRG